MRKCFRCGDIKPLTEFHNDKRRGTVARCKPCRKLDRLEQVAGTYQTRRPKAEIPEGYAYCLKCKEIKPRDAFGIKQIFKTGIPSRCKACHNKRNRVDWNLVKAAAYAKYGSMCACCGEAREPFLQIDHIDDNGAEHRRELGCGHLYTWLRKHNYPPGFQILCANCNWAKRYGVCPHQLEKLL